MVFGRRHRALDRVFGLGGVMTDAANSARQKDRQLTAWLACTGVAMGFAIYWWQEIQSVLELLEMAYG